MSDVRTAFAGPRPHAYNPRTQPELFEGVLGRRSVAFLIDATLILLFTVSAYLLVFILGFVTLGLGWLLFGLIFPGVALGYYALTLGINGSTPGMAAMGLELRMWYGEPVYVIMALAHAILFWLTIAMFTPIVLLIGFFNDRRRLLHDLLLGTVMINGGARRLIERA